MKWLRFRIKTTVDAEDIVISTLYDIGLEGAQIEDNVPLSALEKEQMFVDIPPVTGKYDGTAYLSFFVEELDKKDEILSDIKRELDELRDFNIDIGEGSVTVTETEDIDWINNWKSISISSLLMMFWSFPRGRKSRKRIRVSLSSI